ncbi:MAG: threonylcarbamoyl-AMP synthase [Abditibacteriota bacterium]|nr:threonylcarbamoyl-AMP synthase [Abditibacteriota bacterium]
MDITRATEAGIYAAARETARALKEGKVAVFPTETVYGIGCLMSDTKAAERIYGIKGRQHSKPLPVMVDCVASVEKAAFPVPGLEALEGVFMPGPLTVVLKKKDRVPPVISGGLDTVAVRIPDHPFLLAVLRELGEPIAATSANPSGLPAPASFDMLDGAIKDAADLAVDMGPCRVGAPSAIADLTGPEVRILREGGITAEELGKWLKKEIQ